MVTQVLQKGRGLLWAGQSCCSTVGSHQVASVTQLSVVLLPTILALEELPAGWEALMQLAFQMVLLVEHGLKGGTMMLCSCTRTLARSLSRYRQDS